MITPLSRPTLANQEQRLSLPQSTARPTRRCFAGTVMRTDVEARIAVWIAHAGHADTFWLIHTCHTLFENGLGAGNATRLCAEDIRLRRRPGCRPLSGHDRDFGSGRRTKRDHQKAPYGNMGSLSAFGHASADVCTTFASYHRPVLGMTQHAPQQTLQIANARNLPHILFVAFLCLMLRQVRKVEHSRYRSRARAVAHQK